MFTRSISFLLKFYNHSTIKKPNWKISNFFHPNVIYNVEKIHFYYTEKFEVIICSKKSRLIFSDFSFPKTLNHIQGIHLYYIQMFDVIVFLTKKFVLKFLDFFAFHLYIIQMFMGRFVLYTIVWSDYFLKKNLIWNILIFSLQKY